MIKKNADIEQKLGFFLDRQHFEEESRAKRTVALRQNDPELMKFARAVRSRAVGIMQRSQAIATELNRKMKKAEEDRIEREWMDALIASEQERECQERIAKYKIKQEFAKEKDLALKRKLELRDIFLAELERRRQARKDANKGEREFVLKKQQEMQEIEDFKEYKKELIKSAAEANRQKQGTAPLISSDGSTLLTEKSQILKRWAEYFRSVLTCSSDISDAAIDQLLQMDTNNDLDLPPSLPETIRAMQQISSGKALVSDAIPSEIY
ncbi:unnamed protein product [Schistocephalus solidus]|uniref:Trichohyalin-plectin-homology domain-containing protein n=1 Tax=Schistocephalus solidus TaxID=70667 RepID=A0A183SQY2_SCHSO|nr:unnamed protein product [Schistocephalus solidus]